MVTKEGQPSGAVIEVVDKYVADQIARRQTAAELSARNQLTEEEAERRHELIAHVRAGIATLLEVCQEIPNSNEYQKTFEPVPMGRLAIALPWREDQRPRSVFAQPFADYNGYPVIDLAHLDLDVYVVKDPDVSEADGRLSGSYAFDHIGVRRIRREDFSEDYRRDRSGIRYFGREGLRRLEGFDPMLYDVIAHAQAMVQA